LKAIGHKAKNAQLQRRDSVRPVTANPIEKMLFMGMMMNAWKNYAKITSAKMRAAQENGVDYVYSESEEDSQQNESEYEDSCYDHDDEGPGAQEGGHFSPHNPGNNFIEEEEEEDPEECLSRNDKGKPGFIVDEERRMLSNLQVEMTDENFGALSLKLPQTRARRNLSSFTEKKDLPGIKDERKQSLPTLPPPKIFMHNAEGEIHDITPKISDRGELSFVYHANASSKSFNNC